MSKSRRPRAPPLAVAAGATRCRGAVPTPALRHAATANAAATLGAATAAAAAAAAALGAAAARAAPAAARELVSRDRRGGTAGLGV